MDKLAVARSEKLLRAYMARRDICHMPKYSSRCAERHELSLAGVQHDDPGGGFMHVARRSSIELSRYYRLLNLSELGKRLYKSAGRPMEVDVPAPCCLCHCATQDNSASR